MSTPDQSVNQEIVADRMEISNKPTSTPSIVQFVVENRINGGQWMEVGRLAANQPNFSMADFVGGIEYECRIVAIDGDGCRRVGCTSSFQISSGPKILAPISRVIPIQAMGQTKLDVKYSGYPPPSTQWTDINGEPLSDKIRCQYSNSGGQFVSSLIISQMDGLELKSLKFQIENSLGKDEAVFDLVLKNEEPALPATCNQLPFLPSKMDEQDEFDDFTFEAPAEESEEFYSPEAKIDGSGDLNSPSWPSTLASTVKKKSQEKPKRLEGTKEEPSNLDESKKSVAVADLLRKLGSVDTFLESDVSYRYWRILAILCSLNGDSNPTAVLSFVQEGGIPLAVRTLHDFVVLDRKDDESFGIVTEILRCLTTINGGGLTRNIDMECVSDILASMVNLCKRLVAEKTSLEKEMRSTMDELIDTKRRLRIMDTELTDYKDWHDSEFTILEAERQEFQQCCDEMQQFFNKYTATSDSLKKDRDNANRQCEQLFTEVHSLEDQLAAKVEELESFRSAVLEQAKRAEVEFEKRDAEIVQLKKELKSANIRHRLLQQLTNPNQSGNQPSNVTPTEVSSGQPGTPHVLIRTQQFVSTPATATVQQIRPASVGGRYLNVVKPTSSPSVGRPGVMSPLRLPVRAGQSPSATGPKSPLKVHSISTTGLVKQSLGAQMGPGAGKPGADQSGDKTKRQQFKGLMPSAQNSQQVAFCNNCRTGCKHGRCPCAKNKVPCTDQCNCRRDKCLNTETGIGCRGSGENADIAGPSGQSTVFSSRAVAQKRSASVESESEAKIIKMEVNDEDEVDDD